MKYYYTAKLMNIPEDRVDEMIKKGYLSYSWCRKEEVYRMYVETRAVSGKTKSAIVYDIAAKTGLSDRIIYSYIATYE